MKNLTFSAKILRLFVALVTVLCISSAKFAAAAEKDTATLSDARMEYVCALASLAGYNDELNVFVRQALEANGFRFVPLKERDADTAKMFLITKEDFAGNNIYILVATGTEDLKDVETDLQTKRVPFPAGKKGENVPTVHHGFYNALDKEFFNLPREEFGGLTVSEKLVAELKDSSNKKLYLTGHSLGGAVATLAAASLSESGIPAEQLEVISFGAPAVGDAAFAETYKDKFVLKRIVTTRDPIAGVLQSVKNGYSQQGEAIKRKNKAYGDRMAHLMSVYLDCAIRNYYDVREKAQATFAKPTPAVRAKAYVAPVNFNLDVNISADEKYMKYLVQDALTARIADPVFSVESREEFDETMKNAKAAGCDYAIVTDIFGGTVKGNRQTCRIVMEETVYNAEGSVVAMQSASTLTANLTPIEAVMYLHEQCRGEREKALKGE